LKARIVDKAEVEIRRRPSSLWDGLEEILPQLRPGKVLVLELAGESRPRYSLRWQLEDWLKRRGLTQYEVVPVGKHDIGVLLKEESSDGERDGAGASGYGRGASAAGGS
jgi:hypothetical protein